MNLLSCTYRGPLYYLSSSFFTIASLRFPSPPLKFPKHFSLVSLLFFFFIFLLSRSAALACSLIRCILDRPSALDASFQYSQTITHSCCRGTIINHSLDSAETMLGHHLFTTSLHYLRPYNSTSV